MTAHTNHPDAPADTQMMPIVHSALRRDLVRLRIVLGTPGGGRAASTHGLGRARPLADALPA